jgi:hypothetical protein
MEGGDVLWFSDGDWTEEIGEDVSILGQHFTSRKESGCRSCRRGGRKTGRGKQ